MKFTYYYILDYLKKDEIKKLNFSFKNKSKDFTRQATTIKTSTAVQMPYDELKKIKDVHPVILNINRSTFGFDLYENLTDYVVHNTYSETNKGQYKWHQDCEPYSRNYTIKLTTLINLSEKKYSGGEFSIFDLSVPIHVKELDNPGCLVCFPAIFSHKVSPVTKGTRMSCTIFNTGRWWK